MSFYSTDPAKLLEVLAATAYPEPESQIHRDITEKVWKEIVRPALPPNGKILDIGCGEGCAMELFKAAGFEARGVAATKEDVNACEAKGLDCHLGDMHDLREGNTLFCLVWMRHVLEHSPFPLMALSEAKKFLASGGWLYVEVPAPDTACQHEMNKNHYSVFGQRAWKALLVKAGFEVCREEQLDFRTPAGADRYFLFLCRKPEK